MAKIYFKNPDYGPELRGRKALFDTLENNKFMQDGSKFLYKKDPKIFINNWMITFDPRKKPGKIPMVLFPKQEEFIDWLKERYEKREDGIVEKSRDMGVTWLCVAFAIWLFLFHEGSKVGFASRKESLVDRAGDPDSIFEKMRMALTSLPYFLLPKGFDILKNTSHMKMINPENGNTITGEAGDNIGRGGRNSIYFKDESAFYERPQLVDASLSENSECKIDVSTHNGVGTLFYQKRFGGKIPLFIFDWHDDPRKDQAWYDEKVATEDPLIIAQEIDRNPGASITNMAIPGGLVSGSINWIDEKELDEEPLWAGLDVADTGKDEKVLVITRGPKMIDMICWKDGDAGESGKKAYTICRDRGVQSLKFDAIGVGAGAREGIKQVDDGKVRVVAVTVSEHAPESQYNEDKTNRQMFTSIKGMMWWGLRRRCERTQAYRKGEKSIKLNDTICLLDDKILLAEISQPRYHFRGGRIEIESKESLKERGIGSTNRADALLLSLYDDGSGRIVTEHFAITAPDYLYQDYEDRIIEQRGF